MIYPMVPFPTTLNGLSLDFNVTGLLLMQSTYCVYMRSWRAICLR